jgi:hypothetical protein
MCKNRQFGQVHAVLLHTVQMMQLAQRMHRGTENNSSQGAERAEHAVLDRPSRQRTRRGRENAEVFRRDAGFVGNAFLTRSRKEREEI